MSDYIESLFQGVDMLIDKKLENLNYDTTIICTVTDNSDSKNGKYRVTDGSIAFTAYSDVSTYRSGEQVRVNVPQGDMTKKKFIIGKYLSDDNNSALTYVSPLNSVINITGNLFDLSGQWGILANGPNTAVELWEDKLNIKQYGDLQANGIYNTLIIKAEFKTDLYNYNYINGTYGLRIELDVRPTPDSTAKYTKIVELSSKEMFGNPYNFTIFAPQAKVFNVVSAGVIEKIKLYLYQNNDFVNDREERIIPIMGTPENIFVKNIEIGLGSNVLDVEDNTVRIYSKEGTNYSPEDYKRSLNLVWYNKDENNQSIGFEDQQINDKLYNEFDYLQLVNLDQRLLNQQGKENVNNDKTSLTLAANAEQIKDILNKVADKMSYDLNSEFNKIMDYSLPDEIIKILQGKKEALTALAAYLTTDTNNLNDQWQKQYKDILSFVYKLQNYNRNPSGSSKPSLIDLEDIENFCSVFLNIKIPNQEMNEEDKAYKERIKDYETIQTTSIKTVYNEYLMKITNDIIAPEGYTEIFNIFNHQISKTLESIKKLLDEIPDDYSLIESFLKTIAANDTQILAAYKQTDLSMYDNQYDIYWYRYEEKYEAPDTEYKLMPNGWKIYETQGKTTLADKYFISGIELDPTLDQEKFVALVIYNHEIYKSNELVFNNTNPLPTQKETDATDTLRIEHIVNSFNTYHVYDSTYNLKDALDADRDREMRCHYDGLRYKDDILKGATIHWYIPVDNTMITYDEAFLKKRRFDLKEKSTRAGYIEFTKTITQILASTLNSEQQKSWGKKEEDGGKGFTLKQEGDDNYYDDRSFWYKIKSQLDTGLTNNDIICRVVLALDTKEVETKEFFFFGLTGNTGTKYTFNIYNDNKKKAFVTSDKDNDPLKLSIELRDPTYKVINFAKNPSVNWLGYKKIGNTSPDFKPPEHAKVSGNNITLSEEPISGIIIGETNIDYFHPLKKDSETEELELNTGEDAKLDNTKNPLPVALSCLYPVPYSISEDYVLDGPINIIYDNFGVLNSKMNYDTHYQLKNKNSDVIITSHEGKTILWDINYGIVRVNIDDNKRVTPVKNEAITIQSIPENNKDKDVYGSYAPILTKDRRLQPSPIYLSDLYMIPFVEAYIIDDSNQKVIIYSQPIIIKQDKYPSEFLNEWNGGYYVDDKAGLIMSSMVGAGRKNFTNNTFDGILMGEVAKQADVPTMKDNLGEGIHSGLGLYGFHDGEQSFGFNIDGSAFIGKASKGRIMFDGNNGFIASANWFTGEGNNTTHPDYSVDNPYPYGGKIGTDGAISKSSNAGMCIDLQNGHIDAYDFKLSSDNIYLNSNPGTGDYFLRIGNDKKGYLSFDSQGGLNLVVNRFSLLGINNPSCNLLRQTNPKPISNNVYPELTAWTGIIIPVSNVTLYENSFKDTALTFGGQVKQSNLQLKRDQVYTLSGYVCNGGKTPRAPLISFYTADSTRVKTTLIQSQWYDFNGRLAYIETETPKTIEPDPIQIEDNEVYELYNTSLTWRYFEITFSCSTADIDMINFDVNTTMFWHLSLVEGSVGGWSYAPEDLEENNQIQIDNSISQLETNYRMDQDAIFNTLFDDGRGNIMDGIQFIKLDPTDEDSVNKLFISATYIKTGVLKSEYYDGEINSDGTILQHPTKGSYFNLNTGTISTPYFSISQTESEAKSGTLAGWTFYPDKLEYIREYDTESENNTIEQIKEFEKGDVFLNYLMGIAESSNSLPVELEGFYTDIVNYNVAGVKQYYLDLKSLNFDDILGIYIIDHPHQPDEDDEEPTEMYFEFVKYIDKKYYDVAVWEPYILILPSSLSTIGKSVVENAIPLYNSSYNYRDDFKYVFDQPPPFDNRYILFQSYDDLDADHSPKLKIVYKKNIYSCIAPRSEYANSQPMFVIGAKSKEEIDHSKMAIYSDGTIYCGNQNFIGQCKLQGNSFSFCDNNGNEFGSLSLNTLYSSTMSYLNALTWYSHKSLNLNVNGDNDTIDFRINSPFPVCSIYSPNGREDVVHNSIIHTEGAFGGIAHYRNNVIGKFGIGGGNSLSYHNGASTVLEQCTYKDTPVARLELYMDDSYCPSLQIRGLDLNEFAASLGTSAKYGSNDMYPPLIFIPPIEGDAVLKMPVIAYDGAIAAEGMNATTMSVDSVEDIKRDITKSSSILHLFDKSQSNIYSYKLKPKSKLSYKNKLIKNLNHISLEKTVKNNTNDDVFLTQSTATEEFDTKENSTIQYGFVIGDNYKVPEEVLNENKTGINLYSMASLNWKATQELYELYQDLSSKIDDLQNINGEKGEINNEINK